MHIRTFLRFIDGYVVLTGTNNQLNSVFQHVVRGVLLNRGLTYAVLYNIVRVILH
jgi:hypothetical protein